MQIKEISWDKNPDEIYEFNNPGNSIRKYPITYVSEDSLKEYADLVEQEFGKDSVESHLFGAFDNDKLIGYVNCDDAGYAGLYEFGGMITNKDVVFSIEVDRKYRGQNIGSALLKKAFETYPDSMFIGFIDCDNKSDALKSFYSKNGFDVSEFDTQAYIIRDRQADFNKKSYRDRMEDKIEKTARNARETSDEINSEKSV